MKKILMVAILLFASKEFQVVNAEEISYYKQETTEVALSMSEKVLNDLSWHTQKMAIDIDATLEKEAEKVRLEKEKKALAEAEALRISLLKKEQEVMITSYNGEVLGSGISKNSLVLNDMGWYTYQGKVVVATATTLCTQVKNGACGAYNSIPQGFSEFSFFDEFDLHYNGRVFRAIVLDSCGACYWPEPKQRVDVMTPGSIGKQPAKIVY